MTKQEIEDQDELGELPPLDGDSDSGEKPDDGDADSEDVFDGAGGDATLDDATGEDDPPDAGDLELDDVDGGWLGEAGEADDLDLGGADAALIDFADDTSAIDEDGAAGPSRGVREAEDEAPIGEDDLGLGDAPERGGLDLGDEGPVDADEELREADLPALDADDEGELEDIPSIDPAFASEEPLGVPWAAEPWSRVGAPVALGRATAVACAGRGALVVARAESGDVDLVRVDLEGMCERLSAEGLTAAEVRSIAVDKQVVVAVLRGGRLVVSRNSGGVFAPMPAPKGEAFAAADAVFASDRLWVRTRTGGLVVHDVHADADDRPAIERCPLPGFAAALTRDVAIDAALATVLVVDEVARPTAVVHVAPGATTRREAIDMPEADSPALFAVQGVHMAYSARRGGVVWAPSGHAWRLFEWEGRVTALSFIDNAGTLAAGTYSEADDTTTLVRIDAAGNASVVARIGAAPADAESDGRVVCMAHDEARGVLWVAGGFGVEAFAIK